MKIINNGIVLLVLFLLSLSPFAYAFDEADNNKINLIEDAIAKKIIKGDIPGLAISIVKDDKVYYQNTYGYSDINNNIEVTSNTCFELGSNSKAFTGLAILKLEKDGLLSINDDITKYIPWINFMYKNEKQIITIEQLLHHTSGIPFCSIKDLRKGKESNAIEENVKVFNNYNLDREPGSSYEYATVNYDILGLIIEKITDMTYEEYIQKNILDTFSLDNTYLYKDEIYNNKLAKGYKYSYGKQREYIPPEYRGNKPAAYIISNIDDMSKWMMIQLGNYDKNIFDYEIIKKSHLGNNSVEVSDENTLYAAGWDVYQDGTGEVSHGGENHNYSSFILLREDEDFGIAILANTNTRCVDELAVEIRNIMINKENCNNESVDIQIFSDKIVIIFIVISLMIMFYIISKLKRYVTEIEKCKRNIKEINIQRIIILIMGLLITIGINGFISKIPSIFAFGLTWKFILEWFSEAIKALLVLIIVNLWITYICCSVKFLTFKNKF